MDNFWTTSLFDIFLIIFFVLLNGFFVAAEFAIVKVRSTRLAQLRTKRATLAQNVISNLDAYLSATQLGITLASLGLGWIGEPAISRMIEPLLKYFHTPEWLIHTLSFGIGFFIITFLHIVIGEMAPKSIAIRKAEATTLRVSVPLNWFYQIFRPFIFLLNGSANLILKWAGLEHTETQQAHTEEEIRMLLAQSHKSGIIDQTELTLFDNIFDFTERVAREVMVPRINMTCLYENVPFSQNFSVINQSRYTRFPFCGRDKDDIKGIIHIRDVFQKLANDEPFELSDLRRPAIIIPETMELKDVLKVLQKNHAEMAVVIDEFGGTSGLITVEDIIEEIFGEMQDEFDNEKPFFQKLEKGTSIDPHLLIEDVNEYFDINIDDPDNDTIGGWLFSRLNKIPVKGDKVTFDKYTFIIQEVKQFQIKRILVIETINDEVTTEEGSTEENQKETPPS
jgi:CBS domain containing-hemolysin-like protein